MAEPRATIGVIGGSGLYQMPGLEQIEEVALDTPFGAPSDAYTIGTIAGERVAFLPRHGRGHRIPPTEIPVQANIYGFKMLGVSQVLSVSAVGSMKLEIEPLDLVVPDQIFDRTVLRPRTFFGDGIVGHVGFGDPFCPDLRRVLVEAATATGATVHPTGAYICIEGPQFSTRAESRIYRQWGVDVIGMTAIPEAKLAREAELCYATLALATDYDVWHESEEAVTVEMVVENMHKNVVRAQEVIRRAVPLLAAVRTQRGCSCSEALAGAIMTAPERVPLATRRRLGLLLDKYLPPA
ncbi:MAG: S-methyl-5'-thioadenosine phosphorylase [Chloroflexi bacterium]|nr:S-methyl-5'-thioadenosine phosphorylase [Chloroflexota bacterium]